MEITEFLAARDTEDEDLARKIAEKVSTGRFYEDADGMSATAFFDLDYNQGGFVVSTARVLAEVAARRRLMGLCATWIAEGERHVGGRDAMSIAARAQAIAAETVLRALVQPHASHEDFDPAWRA